MSQAGLRIAAFLATALLASTTDAATITYAYNDEGNADWTFTDPFIAPPMSGDLGESASFFGIVNGTQHSASGPPAALLSGSGGTE